MDIIGMIRKVEYKVGTLKFSGKLRTVLLLQSFVRI
jgi:hypothetical protein